MIRGLPDRDALAEIILGRLLPTDDRPGAQPDYAAEDARGKADAILLIFAQQKDADIRRMNWLEDHTVEVRISLRHGSRHLFWANPDDDAEGEIGPSDIREQIDYEIRRKSEGVGP